jgi:spore coat protein A
MDHQRRDLNESLTLVMPFDTMPTSPGGRYMMHCHNLVHEDHDMMVQFSVGDLRNNDPITSDPPKVDATPLGSFPAVYRAGFPLGT